MNYFDEDKLQELIDTINELVDELAKQYCKCFLEWYIEVEKEKNSQDPRKHNPAS